MGRLTTHVLDTGAGRPADDLRIDLVRPNVSDTPVASMTTNADGRIDQPLAEGESFSPGTYELRFHVGDYYRAQDGQASFYDIVPIRFSVVTAAEHYHVPLLLSPFGYTTYRGS
ncbi:MAG: hydroxyisourate hydrolase [Hyphomicrobiales bacterium]|nr:hydroxyisourate hydrolase [Hyphomicrobiales bacterium]